MKRKPKDTVHGEGNYKAAREFDKAESDFVAAGKVEAAARDAAPKSDSEARELEAAEREGRRRAREEDSAITGAMTPRRQIAARHSPRRARPRS